MAKAVFLDRDGVVNKTVVIHQKPYPPADEKGLNWSELRPQLKKAGRWHVETY